MTASLQSNRFANYVTAWLQASSAANFITFWLKSHRIACRMTVGCTRIAFRIARRSDCFANCMTLWQCFERVAKCSVFMLHSHRLSLLSQVHPSKSGSKTNLKRALHSSVRACSCNVTRTRHQRSLNPVPTPRQLAFYQSVSEVSNTRPNTSFYADSALIMF